MPLISQGSKSKMKPRTNLQVMRVVVRELLSLATMNPHANGCATNNNHGAAAVVAAMEIRRPLQASSVLEADHQHHQSFYHPSQSTSQPTNQPTKPTNQSTNQPSNQTHLRSLPSRPSIQASQASYARICYMAALQASNGATEVYNRHPSLPSLICKDLLHGSLASF